MIYTDPIQQINVKVDLLPNSILGKSVHTYMELLMEIKCMKIDSYTEH